MFNKDNIKILGFYPKENSVDVFTKMYFDKYLLEIDFHKEIINYGDKIICENRTTQNFSQPENFVVLECVNRLLEKGYQPENIILEKTWSSGHGTSGRLDICVTRPGGSEYLLIECKTWGKEFEKEFARMKKDGGQLFTYFKFSNKADVIMLYTSELIEKEIVFRNEIVKIEDDYRTGDVKDFYEKWNKLTKDNGVFELRVNPYNFESKALTIEDLEEIKQEDSSFIFNRFLEILRHNVVSDKGNAFNRIFTLFLCKIYDEKDKEGGNNELEFQWFESPFTYEGKYYEKDTHITFQIRLTDLYKKGMKTFLEKNVTDFSESEFNSKYSYLTDEQRNPILLEFRKIRLEKNNEFAIKDVYDEQSFNDNAVVVKEIVELLQGYKLRYTKKQQYLSDFFELLLTTGLKQESGQFFTPIPVAQFVIKSLPIDTIIKQKLNSGEINEYLPYIIDYAAGSGHFLTETMHEVQRIINNNEFPNLKADVKRFIKQAKEYHFDWAFNYVYGIEKDYRLVKVGKVGCYLHGDGLANVIHSDGLANFEHKDYKGKLAIKDKNFMQENKQFDIIVSNPPYAIDSFRNVSRNYFTEHDFELYNNLTDNSSEIECLFIERTKQLLKDGGVAGIILPISIKSEKNKIIKKAREIIFNFFEIISIVELGKNTFLATPQETTIYFLRRRNNYISKNLKIAVDKFFIHLQDVTLNGIENPITKYINYVWESITIEDYKTLLKSDPNNTITNHVIYKEYQKKLKTNNNKEFCKLLLEIENEKIFYFIITFPQKIVLVKSGEKNIEKNFLGYKFSERRTQEGIKSIQKGKIIEDCTKLFNEKNDFDSSKINYYIKNAFLGNFELEINNNLSNHLSYHKLFDLLTFNESSFDLTINTSEFKEFIYPTKFQSEHLEYLLDDNFTFNSEKIEKSSILNEGKYPVITQEKEKLVNGFTNSENPITNFPIVLFGDHSCIFKYIDFEFFRGADGIVLLPVKVNIIPKYLFYFLDIIVKCNIENYGKYERHFKYLKRKKIPLPPIEIQRNLVLEIERLEEKAKTIVINDLDSQKEKIIKKYLL